MIHAVDQPREHLGGQIRHSLQDLLPLIVRIVNAEQTGVLEDEMHDQQVAFSPLDDVRLLQGEREVFPDLRLYWIERYEIASLYPVLRICRLRNFSSKIIRASGYRDDPNSHITVSKGLGVRLHRLMRRRNGLRAVNYSGALKAKLNRPMPGCSTPVNWLDRVA